MPDLHFGSGSSGLGIIATLYRVPKPDPTTRRIFDQHIMHNAKSRFSHSPMRHFKERVIEFLLFLAALSAVATTVAIVVILVTESLGFFEHVSLKEFLTGTQWTPLFEDAHYGILPLVAGTLVTEVKYIPLPDAAYKLALENFAKRKTGTGFGGVPEVGVSVEELMKREGKH